MVENRALGAGAFLLTLRLPLPQFPHPGKFLHIKPTSEGTDPLLRRAFSIFDYDPDRGTVDVLYKVFGRGSAILSRVPAGHRLDLLGPLGEGFPIPTHDRNLVMVGGGVGIPPVFLLAKYCLMNGHPASRIAFLAGFGTAAESCMAERVGTLPIELKISTDDGSQGYHGFVTDLLRTHLAAAAAATTVFACGPEPMLKAVQSLTREFKVPAFLSLESIMPCGVGTCLGCVVKKDGEEKYLRVCREGPVFCADEVEL